jgi:hypothetical protein
MLFKYLGGSMSLAHSVPTLLPQAQWKWGSSTTGPLEQVVVPQAQQNPVLLPQAQWNLL